MSLRETINAYCLARTRRLPDLDHPRGYNDKINWLKLYDQRPEQITACDKRAVREMVAMVAGSDCLVPIQAWPPVRFPCIAKVSHDSGGNIVLRSPSDVPAASQHLDYLLSRPYGVEKGEWAYAWVRPTIVVEDLLATPTDYKFHCVHGVVAWVQVIWNRDSGKASEAIFLPDGTVTDLHMDEKMRHCPRQDVHPGATAWSVLSVLAEKLARGWRYVRADLYWSAGQAWFGELTFWPRGGCYRSADEPVFGAMMNIDLNLRYPAIMG